MSHGRVGLEGTTEFTARNHVVVSKVQLNQGEWAGRLESPVSFLCAADFRA